jgi:hypothetical protein
MTLPPQPYVAAIVTVPIGLIGTPIFLRSHNRCGDAFASGGHCRGAPPSVLTGAGSEKARRLVDDRSNYLGHTRRDLPSRSADQQGQVENQLNQDQKGAENQLNQAGDQGQQ